MMYDSIYENSIQSFVLNVMYVLISVAGKVFLVIMGRTFFRIFSMKENRNYCSRTLPSCTAFSSRSNLNISMAHLIYFDLILNHISADKSLDSLN